MIQHPLRTCWFFHLLASVSPLHRLACGSEATREGHPRETQSPWAIVQCSRPHLGASGKGEAYLTGPCTCSGLAASPRCLPHCPPEFLPTTTDLTVAPLLPVEAHCERYWHLAP